MADSFVGFPETGLAFLTGLAATSEPRVAGVLDRFLIAGDQGRAPNPR
jgi:hypothetical protein